MWQKLLVLLLSVCMFTFIFGETGLTQNEDKSYTVDQLSDAILSNDILLVNKIIESNTVNINQKNLDGNYPLEGVLPFENCDMAKVLLKAGADPHVITAEGISIYEIVMERGGKYFKSIFKKFDPNHDYGK